MTNVNDDDKAVVDRGVDPIDAMDADALRAEVLRLRNTNKVLNRRATGADSPWQGRAMRAESLMKHYKDSSWFSFDRLCRAHDNLRDIYLALYEARGLPLPKLHSVMDSRCDGGEDSKERVWAMDRHYGITVPFKVRYPPAVQVEPLPSPSPSP